MAGKIAQFGALLLLAFLLSSCASVQHAEEVQEGKIYFEDGDFKPAFHKLLPAAAAGNARAQYAVGYMYYYGYGVHEDTESGLFWMQKSAEQHYPPAVKALNIIEMCHGPSSYSPIYKPVSQPTIQEPIQKVTTIERQEVPVRKTMPTEKLIRADGYGLQLMGSYELADVKKAQTKLGVQSKSVIWHAENKGKDWYVLIYKHYATVADAEVAKKELPPELHALGPWVRGLDTLG